MDYDNLKECSNCGKYTTSLSASNRCHSCQQVEDYVPDWYYTRCPICNTLNAVSGDETKFTCVWCLEAVSS